MPVKLLLDTHIILWSATDLGHLPLEAARMIEDRENEVFFSVASLWEIVIKRALGRSSFDVEASVLRRGLLDNGFCELPIESKHVLAVQGLPPLHGDPFDRVLIAQATVEGLLLLTSDDMVARYPGPIRRV